MMMSNWVLVMIGFNILTMLFSLDQDGTNLMGLAGANTVNLILVFIVLKGYEMKVRKEK